MRVGLRPIGVVGYVGVVMFITGLLLLFVASMARSRDLNGYFAQLPDAQREWLRRQMVPGTTNQRCCDESDGNTAQEDIRDGKYWTTWDAVAPMWFPVPREAILTGPNIYGRPVVWVFYESGLPFIKCFAPGAGI